MADSIVLRIQGLRKNYGTQDVLRGVSFTLRSGAFYVLLGCNGAGKSTLLRIIAGLEQAAQGGGQILGHALDSNHPTRKAAVGLISESIEYPGDEPVSRTMWALAGMYPNWDQRLFDRFMAEFQLEPSRPYSAFSRGQKMQIVFAATMASRPRVILVDEITAVLDTYARRHVLRALGEFASQGGTVVMATNIVSEAQGDATDLILIDDGQVKLQSPVHDLQKHFAKVRVIACDAKIFTDPGCIEVEINSDKSISYVAPRGYLEEIRRRPGVVSMEEDRRAVTAEDVFKFYTSQRRVAA